MCADVILLSSLLPILSPTLPTYLLNHFSPHFFHSKHPHIPLGYNQPIFFLKTPLLRLPYPTRA
jgi:hypothetical protein